MASQFASGKVPVLTRKLNAADSTAYLDSDVGITSGRLYLSNNLQEEWISFSGVAASGSEFAYSGLVRGLSQTADPATASTGKTWLAGQQCALVEMHDQMMNKQRPEPKIFATTAARDSALGADGAATSPWVNVYVTDVALHYNYNLGTNQWEAIDTGTITPNASTTVAGKVEIATQTEVDTPTDTGGTGAIVAVIPSTFQQGITNRVATTSEARAMSSATKVLSASNLNDVRASTGEFSAGTATDRFPSVAQIGGMVKAPTTGLAVNTNYTATTPGFAIATGQAYYYSGNPDFQAEVLIKINGTTKASLKGATAYYGSQCKVVGTIMYPVKVGDVYRFEGTLDSAEFISLI